MWTGDTDRTRNLPLLSLLHILFGNLYYRNFVNIQTYKLQVMVKIYSSLMSIHCKSRRVSTESNKRNFEWRNFFHESQNLYVGKTINSIH